MVEKLLRLLIVICITTVCTHFAITHVLESNITSPMAESDTDAEYHTHEILGFTVHIQVEDVEEQPELAEEMLWFIRGQLQKMIEVLPLDKVKLLRNVETWVNNDGDVDDDDETCSYACYVPERYRGDDFFEDRRGAVIIRDFERPLRNSWCCSFGLMIHEMTHAYHDQFIADGFNNDLIEDTFEDAEDSGDYEDNQVLYPWWDDQYRDHYGMTNEREFFATMTQTFFLWYYVFPHTVRDVYELDRDTYQMVVNAWYTEVEDNEVDPSEVTDENANPLTTQPLRLH